MKVHRTLCSPASPVEGSEHKEAREDGSAVDWKAGEDAGGPRGGNLPGLVLPVSLARDGRMRWMA
jgi:hypothetical protein